MTIFTNYFFLRRFSFWHYENRKCINCVVLVFCKRDFFSSFIACVHPSVMLGQVGSVFFTFWQVGLDRAKENGPMNISYFDFLLCNQAIRANIFSSRPLAVRELFAKPVGVRVSCNPTASINANRQQQSPSRQQSKVCGSAIYWSAVSLQLH